MPLSYKMMDLLNAPDKTFILHACNTKGVWGAGVAAEIKKSFPSSYLEYRNYCTDSPYVGFSVMLSEENNRRIVCLFTSKGYGKEKDSLKSILKNTDLSLTRLKYLLPYGAQVYSPKFNSGLFAVPWEQTEPLLLDFLKERPDVSWTICERKIK